MCFITPRVTIIIIKTPRVIIIKKTLNDLSKISDSNVFQYHWTKSKAYIQLLPTLADSQLLAENFNGKKKILNF